MCEPNLRTSFILIQYPCSPAGHVADEGAVVNIEVALGADEHEDSGAGVHRDVVREVAVLDAQQFVRPDDGEAALVVREHAVLHDRRRVAALRIGRRHRLQYASSTNIRIRQGLQRVQQSPPDSNFSPADFSLCADFRIMHFFRIVETKYISGVSFELCGALN